MVKKDNTKTIVWGIVIIIAAILLVNSGAIQRFAISGNDFICEPASIIYLPDSNFDVINGTINYNDSGISRSLVSGQTYYKLDMETITTYSTIPDLAGTHTIHRYKIDLVDNGTSISLQKCSVVYTKEVQNITVYQNITVPGPTVYVNQTIEVEKDIYVEPTLKEFFNKYYMYLIVGVIIGIIGYILFKKKGKI